MFSCTRLHFLIRPLCPSCRYKMISEFTWPNHDLPSDRDAVKRLLQGCGFDHDVAYGKTKVFIRTPRTLFSLEEQRVEMVQRIVLFLQKVRVSTQILKLLKHYRSDLLGNCVFQTANLLRATDSLHFFLFLIMVIQVSL